MMNILHTLGLMTRKEHERIVEENDEKAYTAWAKMANERDDLKMYRDDWQQKHNAVVGKLKRAATDLAAQAEEIAGLREANASLATGNALLSRENFALRPDAEAMRKKRAADRKRMVGKRGKA